MELVSTIKLKIMKNIAKLIKFIPILVLFIGWNLTAMAQGGVPPPPPDEHGKQSNQPPGGGAPIGSGIAILLSLGAAYGGKKVYQVYQNKE